jgi:hypothetical protein
MYYYHTKVGALRKKKMLFFTNNTTLLLLGDTRYLLIKKLKTSTLLDILPHYILLGVLVLVLVRSITCLPKAIRLSIASVTVTVTVTHDGIDTRIVIIIHILIVILMILFLLSSVVKLSKKLINFKLYVVLKSI